MWQYDTGQQLRISGDDRIDGDTEVHFDSFSMFGAYAKKGVYSPASGTLTVDIPNEFLETSVGEWKKAWIYLTDGGDGQTVFELRIPVRPRCRPADYISQSDLRKRDVIYAAVSAYLSAHGIDNQIFDTIDIVLSENGVNCPRLTVELYQGDYWLTYYDSEVEEAHRLFNYANLPSSGGASVRSGVVNANGTITFTLSDGTSFTTTGAGVIGAKGDPGDDYVLTSADRAEIAAAAAALIDISGKADSADTLAGYGITDAYTKAQVDSAIQTAIGGVENGAY